MGVFNGKMIRKRREEIGMSRTDLADKAGISVRTLEGWENGREPSNLSLLLSVTKVLNCSLQDICKEEVNLRIKNNRTHPDEH